MTRYYLKIKAYQVSYGVIYEDGTERPDCIKLDRKEIPLNKIFIPKKIDQGKWMDPKKAKV